MQHNDNGSLLEPIFGAEFFAVKPIEFNEVVELDFPFDSLDSAEMLRSLLSRDQNNLHPKHKEFIAAIEKIINALDAWRKKHNIIIKVFNKKTNAYIEVDPCQSLIETYVKYSGEDLGVNGINLPFYRDGLPTLAHILTILNSKQVPLPICIDKIKHLLENINICGPGAFTHIQDTYMELTAGAHLSNKLLVLRRQIAEQEVIELIKSEPTIPRGMPMHYINAVINYYHKQLALSLVEDKFIHSCEPIVLERLINAFKIKINLSLTARSILSLLVDQELSELENSITACHEGKDKRSVVEILDDFGKKLLFYGVEDSTKSIYNIPDMLCMNAATCTPVKPERLSWYARDIVTASIYQRLALRNVFNSNLLNQVKFDAKVNDTDQPIVILHRPQFIPTATVVEQPHLSGGLTPYLPFIIQGLCDANPRALEICRFLYDHNKGGRQSNAFVIEVIPAMVHYFHSTEFSVLERAEQDNQIARIMSVFLEPKHLSPSNRLMVSERPTIYDELLRKGLLLPLIQLPIYTPQEHMNRIFALPEQSLREFFSGNSFIFLKSVMAAFPTDIRLNFLSGLINKDILKGLNATDINDIVRSLPVLDKVRIILTALDKNIIDYRPQTRDEFKNLFFTYFKTLTPSDRKQFFETIPAREILSLGTLEILANFDPFEYASILKKIPTDDFLDRRIVAFITALTNPDIQIAICKELLPVMQDAKLDYLREILGRIPFNRAPEVVQYHRALQPLFNRGNSPSVAFNYNIDVAFHLCLYQLPLSDCLKVLETMPAPVVKYALADNKHVVKFLYNFLQSRNSESESIILHLLKLGYVEEVVRGFYGACAQREEKISSYQLGDRLCVLLRHFNETIISAGQSVNRMLDDKFLIALLPPNEKINSLLYHVKRHLPESFGTELLMIATRAYYLQRKNDEKEHKTIPFFSASRTDKLTAASYLMMLLQDLNQPEAPIDKEIKKAIQQGDLGELYACYHELRMWKGVSPSP